MSQSNASASKGLSPIVMFPSNTRIKVTAGDKWILMGTSGSGKTTALKYLDALYTRLFGDTRHYILDSKHDGDFDKYPGRVVSDYCPPRISGRARYQVWQPVKLIPEEIERWLWNVRHDGPAILEIDELAHLIYKRGTYSDEYNVIQKTGRSLGVGTITLTQELSRIPPNAFNQSTHRISFYLEGRYNQMVRNDLLKWKVEQPPDWHGLHYQHINGRGEPRYYRNIQQMLGV